MISPFKKLLIFALACIAPAFTVAQTRPAPADRRSDEHWHRRLKELLPLLGHRNWIAVVDSAYPLQTSPGIETLETDADHLEVVRKVLHEVGESRHVSPVIFTDAELNAVPESDAPGVTYYRDSLGHFLEQFNAGKTEVHSLPHEEIISKLDEAGKTFHILVLKTNLAIPYTSVFIRLDCGYWTTEQENRLREKMGNR